MNNRSLLPTLMLLIPFHDLFSQTRYLEPLFNQVTVTSNVLYGQNATVIAQSQTGQAILQPLVLDVYEPAGDTASTRPLVIVLPGGQYIPPTLNGSCDGSKSDSVVVEICTRLAKTGYVAAAVNYRLGWNPVSPDPQIRLWTYIHALYRGIQDARTAVRYFKKTAAEDANPFRLDVSRIVVWGESTGGQIALGAAYANDSLDWVHPAVMVNFPPLPSMPAIVPQMDGNIWGTDWGIVPPDFPPAFATPGDTLCYPNWPAYSSDFHLCVSMAGFTPNIPWIGTGEIPAILYHAPNDLFRPCGDDILLVGPPINFPIIPVAGSCLLAEQLNANGNNDVFVNANINDCISFNAANLNGGLEGFYPFIGLPQEQGRPWQWVSACSNNPNTLTDPVFARKYIDTIFAYFAPRACAALALCNAQSGANGCGPVLKGKVYVDLNDDGYDPADPPFPGVVLEMQPGDLHAVSGFGGNYLIAAAPGDYTLDIPNLPNYYTSSNTPLTVTIPATGDTVQHIGLKPAVTAHDLQVTVTALTDPRPGFYNTLKVRWKNIGTTQLSGTVNLTTDANYDIFNSNPPASISGQLVTWTFDNLPPLQQGDSWLTLYLPPSVPLGTELTSVVTVEPDGVSDFNPTDNVAAALETVIGSFDPNDKRVRPEGDVTENIWDAYEGWLDYTVRFQNTGTASAIHVLIVDTLSGLLNINTLEIVGASHPMRWEIGGERTVTWYFDNINLPDSTSNEPASHGFVRFRVRPALPFGEMLHKTVYNLADIYFDFNQPVRTNVAVTKFVEALGAKSPLATGWVSIFPNPASGEIRISCQYDAKEAEISIFDVAGKMALFQKVPVSDQQLNLSINTSEWPKGNYVVKIAGGGAIRYGRFVHK